MRWTITTAGSRGDVEPYLALAQGLESAGHEVRVAAGGLHRNFVESRGLEFFGVRGDPAGETQKLVQTGRNPIGFLRSLREILELEMEQGASDYLEACEGSDAVVFSVPGFLGNKAAQKLGIPSAAAAIQPLYSCTTRFPCAFMPPMGSVTKGGALKGAYNYLSYALFEHASWQAIRTPVNRATSRALGMAAESFFGPFASYRKQNSPEVFGWSTSVLPPPYESDFQQTTGYWFLDGESGWEPPDRLREFLHSGPPPLSIGFGSMSGSRWKRAVQICAAAVEQAGQRGVLLGNWGAAQEDEQAEKLFDSLPDEVLVIEDVPHCWLFPRVKAAIHHAGAGTTAAALRAGLPSVTVPFFIDQFFWSQRLTELRVAPEPISAKRLERLSYREAVRSLTQKIRSVVDDQEKTARASRLSERICGENGVGRAVEVLEKTIR